MEETLSMIDKRLQAEGLQAGLAALNATVPHRYTAVYRLNGGTLVNVAFFDKRGEPRPEGLHSVALQLSFCQFVVQEGRFLTDDSGTDDRLDGHPAKGILVAYHGVPVHSAAGWLYGSLCHFDNQAQRFSDDDYALLLAAARLMPQYLPS